MPRMAPLEPETTQGPARDLMESVQQKMGRVPNMMRTMANAPAVLDAYLAFSGKLDRGHLPARLRQQIALAVGQANDCQYCLAAHSTIAKSVGLTSDQIRDSRLGTAIDPKADTLIRFARKVVTDRGKVADADLKAVRSAGFDDEAIAEVVAHVALNIFTNYFNLVTDPEIDFPRAEPLA